MDAFIKIFVCLCRASHMERKANSSQFAFLGNAVGAKRRCASGVGARGTVCPRPDRRSVNGTACPRKVLCAWKLISGGDEASEGACKA